MFERCFGGCGRKNDDYGVAFAVPLTGRWQFNFHPQWSAYGEAGPTLCIHGGWLVLIESEHGDLEGSQRTLS